VPLTLPSSSSIQHRERPNSQGFFDPDKHPSEKMSRYHLKQFEKERMKMAMLRQEETFRQQVIIRIKQTKQLASREPASSPSSRACVSQTARPAPIPKATSNADRRTFPHQVQELHRLYRAQQLLMAGDDAATNEATRSATATAMPPAATRRDLEAAAEDDDDERRTVGTGAGSSSRSWDDDAHSPPQQHGRSGNSEAPPLLLRESELELTLALGCFGGAAPGKKEASSTSVDSRTSVSSSSTESGSAGSPERGVRRRLPPPVVSDDHRVGAAGPAYHYYYQQGWAASGPRSRRPAAASLLAPQVPEFGTIG
jgi:hypothetical protein